MLSRRRLSSRPRRDTPRRTAAELRWPSATDSALMISARSTSSMAAGRVWWVEIVIVFG